MSSISSVPEVHGTKPDLECTVLHPSHGKHPFFKKWVPQSSLISQLLQHVIAQTTCCDRTLVPLFLHLDFCSSDPQATSRSLLTVTARVTYTLPSQFPLSVCSGAAHIPVVEQHGQLPCPVSDPVRGGLVGQCLYCLQRWTVVSWAVTVTPHSLTHLQSRRLLSWHVPDTGVPFFMPPCYCTFSVFRYTDTYPCVTVACSIQLSSMLYRHAAWEPQAVPDSLGVCVRRPMMLAQQRMP